MLIFTCCNNHYEFPLLMIHQRQNTNWERGLPFEHRQHRYSTRVANHDTLDQIEFFSHRYLCSLFDGFSAEIAARATQPSSTQPCHGAAPISSSEIALGIRNYAAACAAKYCATIAGFLVCIKTVPGPANKSVEFHIPQHQLITFISMNAWLSLRTSEFAHQPFTRAEIADDAAARDALEDVFAVPGDEVAVVDDVFFAFAEL